MVHPVMPHHAMSRRETGPYKTAWRRLQAGGRLLLDGGVSTELQRRGLAMDDVAWSARAALDHGEAVVAMHRAYIDAGADIITANTYATSRLVLAPAGLADRIGEINRRGVEAALEARARCGTPDVLVAGSLSHALPDQMAGRPTLADGGLDHPAMLAAFTEMVTLLQDAGADLLLLEMMSKPSRMAAMFDAVATAGLPVWCGLSVARGPAAGPAAALVATHDHAVPFATNVAAAADRPFDLWGVMHSAADVTGAALAALQTAVPARPRMAYPDSGYIDMPSWQFVDVIAPDRFAAFAADWADAGVQVIGGCCGLGPEHIAAIAGLKR